MNFFKPGDQNVAAKTDVKLSGTYTLFIISYFNLNNRQIQKFPARIDSKEELCDIVTRIISQLSLQHTASNYLLADYAVYIPNLPTKLYNDTRVKEGEFSVYRLPNRVTSAVGTTFFSKIINNSISLPF